MLHLSTRQTHKTVCSFYSTKSYDQIKPIDGGKFIVGKFEDTLPEFFSKKRPKASIINFDADLYSSTICALNYAMPVIDKHTILIFDEFLMNENWEEDEYKALEEFCVSNHYTYEVIAISFFTKQVAVKIIGCWNILKISSKNKIDFRWIDPNNGNIDLKYLNAGAEIY